MKKEIKNKKEKVSKYEEKALWRTKELQNYFKKYGMEIESDFVKTIIMTELSDIIFEQHSRSRNNLNIVMISTQLFLCLLSSILLIWDIKISTTTCCINLVLLLLVIVSNSIHTKEWNISKKKLDAIDTALDVLKVNSKSETITELQNRFNLNFNDMLKKEDLEYKDANGVNYRLGDIVYNPCIGDYWVVQKYTEEEKQKYETECDYCLVLNNNKDDYFEDIDVPNGFIIVCKIGDADYDKTIEAMNKLAEERFEWYESESKEDDK